MASAKDGHGPLLVARAASHFASKLNANDKKKLGVDVIDPLSVSLKDLQLGKCVKKPALAEAEHGNEMSRPRDIGLSPADFISMQSLRSRALAGKTNTTSRFSRDQRNLIADLLLDTSVALKTSIPDKVEKDGEKKKENVDVKAAEGLRNQDSEREGDEKERKEAPSELILRGPLRSSRAPIAVFHPYGHAHADLHSSTEIGAAMQSQVRDLNSYTQHFNDYGYECGAYQGSYYWAEDRGNHILPGGISSSSAPDTVPNNNYSVPNAAEEIVVVGSRHLPPPVDYQSGVKTNSFNDWRDAPGTLPTADISCELPDAVSDFILEYSRTYAAPISPTPPSASSSPATCKSGARVSRSDSSSVGSDGEVSPQLRRQLANSNSKFNSPLAAGSVPMTSPAAPLSSDAEPPSLQSNNHHYHYQTGMCGVGTPPPRHAKDRLRAMVSDQEMDEAALWTCKCIRHYPGALRFQDQDRDSLLHIVAQHMDLAKICALVEQMIKMDIPEGEEKPFDMKNNLNETPLFLAVMKGHVEVVNYLLEAGAEPNVQSLRFGNDTPLHYAVAHGMLEITQILCSCANTDVNKSNAKGFTPLSSAILNNGLFDEVKGTVLANGPVVRLLLQYGADPAAVNVSDHDKSVLHYAVEAMDTEMLEVVKDNVAEEQFAELLSKKDANGRMPLDVLQNACIPTSDPNEPELRTRIRVLLSCGANNEDEDAE